METSKVKNCPNCPAFHSVCKSSCCGPVPIPTSTYLKNKHLIQKTVVEVQDLGDHTLPITDTLSCCFLTGDLSCMIYNDRPDVCKKFGDETDLLMTCVYQTKDGNERNSMHKKRLLKEM